MTKSMVDVLVANVLCKGLKFQIGEGACAPICVDHPGDGNRDCPHAFTVHGKLAAQVIRAINERAK